MDVFVIPCFIILFGGSYYVYQYRRQALIQQEQMKVLQGVMVNVDHLLRNMLNALFYFKDLMRDSADIPSQEIEKFDRLINDTRDELESIENVKVIPDNVAEVGVIKDKSFN